METSVWKIEQPFSRNMGKDIHSHTQKKSIPKIKTKTKYIITIWKLKANTNDKISLWNRHTANFYWIFNALDRVDEECLWMRRIEQASNLRLIKKKVFLFHLIDGCCCFGRFDSGFILLNAEHTEYVQCSMRHFSLFSSWASYLYPSSRSDWICCSCDSEILFLFHFYLFGFSLHK